MSRILSRLDLRFSSLPLLRLSTTVTSAPSPTSSSTKWLPMTLAPPVTRTVLSFQYMGIDLIKIQSLRDSLELGQYRYSPVREIQKLRFVSSGPLLARLRPQRSSFSYE